jgi:hypothetical protein
MLKIQEFLRSGSIGDLGIKYGIKSRSHTSHPNLISFKYGQIDSPLGDPLVQECRGIILDRDKDWRVISYPYKKFFNVHEGHAAPIDWSTASILEKLDGCFYYDTSLNLWDGGIVKIGDIVNKSLSPKLIGIDSNGNPVPTYVIGRSKSKGRTNWVDINLKDRPGPHKNMSSKRLRVTTNHEIYNNGCYKLASNIQTDDILTSVLLSPHKAAMHYIRSSLLGDGSIIYNGTNCKFQEGHLSKYPDFEDMAKQYLGDSYLSSRKIISGYGSDITQITSKTYRILKTLRDEWYPNGRKKCIPSNIDWMDAFSFAKWYMDDGSLAHNSKQADRALFATNGFAENDVNRLADHLRKTFSVDVTVYQSKGWNIRINSGRCGEINRFWESISPYIPHGLRYKLPKGFQNVPYIMDTLSRKEEYVPIKIEVNSISYPKLTKKEFPAGRVGYDIQTTTGNYMANGIFVHNSMMQLYNYDGIWYAGTSGTPDGMASMTPMGKDTFSHMFWKLFTKMGYKLPEEGYTYMFEMCTPLNQIVVSYDDPKLVLHGVRSLKTLKEVDPEIGLQYDWDIVRSFDLGTLDEVVEACAKLDPAKYEGFVIRDKDFNRVKLKAPKYVALHHLKNGITPRKIMDVVRRNESDELLAYFPMFIDKFEYAKCVYESLVREIEETYKGICDIDDQKEFALKAVKYKYSPILFKMRSGESVGVREALLSIHIDSVIKLLGNKYLEKESDIDENKW